MFPCGRRVWGAECCGLFKKIVKLSNDLAEDDSLFRFLRVEERDLQAHTPGGGAGWVDRVAVKINSDVDRLRAEASDASGAAAEGDCPAATGGRVVAARGVERSIVVPVGGDYWAACEEPAFFEVVIDEILQQELIDVRA